MDQLLSERERVNAELKDVSHPGFDAVRVRW
jgi:hypothetical protein